MIHLPQRQELRQPALRIQCESAVVAEERLPVRADEKDAAFRCPAAHHRVGPEPSHAARRAALRRHEVDLGVLLVARYIGEQAAVWRDRRPADLAQACGQPTRGPAACIDAPQIVVAHENNDVAADAGLPEVTALGHEARILPPPR
jgi:hypothetical protein